MRLCCLTRLKFAHRLVPLLDTLLGWRLWLLRETLDGSRSHGHPQPERRLMTWHTTSCADTGDIRTTGTKSENLIIQNYKCMFHKIGFRIKIFDCFPPCPFDGKMHPRVPVSTLKIISNYKKFTRVEVSPLINAKLCKISGECGQFSKISGEYDKIT